MCPCTCPWHAFQITHSTPVCEHIKNCAKYAQNTCTHASMNPDAHAGLQMPDYSWGAHASTPPTCDYPCMLRTQNVCSHVLCAHACTTDIDELEGKRITSYVPWDYIFRRRWEIPVPDILHIWYCLSWRWFLHFFFSWPPNTMGQSYRDLSGTCRCLPLLRRLSFLWMAGMFSEALSSDWSQTPHDGDGPEKQRDSRSQKGRKENSMLPNYGSWHFDSFDDSPYQWWTLAISHILFSF